MCFRIFPFKDGHGHGRCAGPTTNFLGAMLAITRGLCWGGPQVILLNLPECCASTWFLLLLLNLNTSFNRLHWLRTTPYGVQTDPRYTMPYTLRYDPGKGESAFTRKLKTDNETKHAYWKERESTRTAAQIHHRAQMHLVFRKAPSGFFGGHREFGSALNCISSRSRKETKEEWGRGDRCWPLQPVVKDTLATTLLSSAGPFKLGIAHVSCLSKPLCCIDPRWSDKTRCSHSSAIHISVSCSLLGAPGLRPPGPRVVGVGSELAEPSVLEAPVGAKSATRERWSDAGHSCSRDIERHQPNRTATAKQ